MDLWIPITIVGTLIQVGRSVGQRRLLGRVSVAGTTYARFFYGCPLAFLALAGACLYEGRLPPTATPTFIALAVFSGICQFAGNALFVALVRASNLTVITTYAKMETVLSPLFSFLLLGDMLSPTGIAGILVALLGVMLLAAAREARSFGAFLAAFLQPPASVGLTVGAVYALVSTGFRAATLELGDVSVLLKTCTLLAWVTASQAVAMGLYLRWRAPPVLTEVVREWRAVSWLGFNGVAASICWMAAFALQKTGYVLAVSQIELVFTYIAAHIMFKERTHPGEIAAILVTVAGIVLAAMAR